MMWSREDSKNLASIAQSLEKLADRELERKLSTQTPDGILSIFKRKEIKVSEGGSLEDEALEEEIKITQRMQNKLSEASADSNMPYFAENLLDEEELETLR